MADALEIYQQNLAALIDAREKAGGRITPFEEQARMHELDNLYMRLDATQRAAIVQMWGMDSPHKPSLKRNPAPVQTSQPPAVAPAGGPQNPSFIASIPSAPTSGMPSYVGQPSSAFDPQPTAAAVGSPITPATPPRPRYSTEQLEDFRSTHQPTVVGRAFLSCSELRMKFDDLDLPMVTTVVVDANDIRAWRSFDPLEYVATGPFTELMLSGGQRLHVVGSVEYFSMMIQRLRSGADTIDLVEQRIFQAYEAMLSRLAQLVSSKPEPGRNDDTEPPPAPLGAGSKPTDEPD